MQNQKKKNRKRKRAPIAVKAPVKEESDSPSEFEEVSLDGSCSVPFSSKSTNQVLYMCRPCNTFFPSSHLLRLHRASVHPKSCLPKLRPRVESGRAHFMGYYRVLDSGEYVCSYCPFSSFTRTTVSSHSQRKHAQEIRSELPESTDCSQQLLLLDEEADNLATEDVERDPDEDDKVDLVRKFLEDSGDEEMVRTCPCCPYETPRCSAYRSHVKRAHRSIWLKSLVTEEPRVPEYDEPEDDVKPEPEDDDETQPKSQDFVLQELVGEGEVVEGQLVEEVVVGDDGNAQLVVRNKRKCPYCPFESYVASTFNSHVSRNHTKPKRSVNSGPRPEGKRREPSFNSFTGYACAYCTFVACTINSLGRHSNRNHEGLRVMITEVPVVSFDCDVCDFKSSGRKVMQFHLKTHRHEMNEEGMYACTMCSYDTTSRMGLQRHISIKHLRPRAPTMVECYECDRCEYKCLNGQAMAWHRRQHDLPEEERCPVLICNECDFSTWKKSQLIMHIRRKHKELVEKPDCNTVGPLVDWRGQPVEEFNEMGEPVMHCDYCDYVTKNKHVLKVHVIRKHTDTWNFECDQCGKKFKVKADLTNHMRFQHKEQPIMCDVCGKQCRNSNLLYLHQKFAHYKPQFECPICHRRMVSQVNLDDHILKQHETNQDAVCEECGKTFKKLARLKVHMRVHTGLRPFTCKICLKAFGRRNGLRQHLLIHSGQRPYVCDICGKAFTQKTGLISHRKSHPGTLPPLPRVTIDHVLSDLLQEEEEYEREKLERGDSN